MIKDTQKFEILRSVLAEDSYWSEIVRSKFLPIDKFYDLIRTELPEYRDEFDSFFYDGMSHLVITYSEFIGRNMKVEFENGNLNNVMKLINFNNEVMGADSNILFKYFGGMQINTDYNDFGLYGKYPFMWLYFDAAQVRELVDRFGIESIPYAMGSDYDRKLILEFWESQNFDIKNYIQEETCRK